MKKSAPPHSRRRRREISVDDAFYRVPHRRDAWSDDGLTLRRAGAIPQVGERRRRLRQRALSVCGIEWYASLGDGAALAGIEPDGSGGVSRAGAGEGDCLSQRGLDDDRTAGREVSSKQRTLNRSAPAVG